MIVIIVAEALIVLLALIFLATVAIFYRQRRQKLAKAKVSVIEEAELIVRSAFMKIKEL